VAFSFSFLAFQLLQHYFPVRSSDHLLSYRSLGRLIILS
jgi:hypothetical protein